MKLCVFDYRHCFRFYDRPLILMVRALCIFSSYFVSPVCVPQNWMASLVLGQCRIRRHPLHSGAWDGLSLCQRIIFWPDILLFSVCIAEIDSGTLNAMSLFPLAIIFFFSVCLFISSLLSNDLEWEVHPGQEIVIWYLCVCGDKCCVFLCICTMRVCVCVCERDLQTRSCCRTADANPFSFCSTPSLIALDIIDCILRWWLRFCSIIHLDLLCVCVWVKRVRFLLFADGMIIVYYSF